MLGVGVTTFNRLDRLERNIEAIQKFTAEPYFLIIADDGSSDDTASFLRDKKVPCILGLNRGVAWNKNRCLFYLHELKRCSTIILLEDDCMPARLGWDKEWIEAANLYGHVNIAGFWFSHLFDRIGSGTALDPYISSHTSAQCSAFSAEALSYVGFMDTRFGRYGFEHADHTKRMLRAGFGGKKGPSDDTDQNYLISDRDLIVECLDAPIDYAALTTNGEIYRQLSSEQIYRHAWRDDSEMLVLRQELAWAERASNI